ncbi:MAG: hypothetical protein ACFB0C_00930 [Leptolyngbyaceae cyanobacterium]
MSKSFKIFLVAALLALTGFLAWKFLLSPSSEPTVNTPAETTEETEPQTPTARPEPFGEAVRTATMAAELTQTATTPEEWSEVGVLWDSAMQFMMKVPEDHAQYGTAQDRIATYAGNRDYAFTNAGLLDP